jgi:GWxTD domain-containing protein
MPNIKPKITNKLKSKLIVIVTFIAILYGCSSSQRTGGNKNVAGIYMPGLNLIDPTYRVFHKNDTLSEIHFRLNSSNVLYTKKRTDTIFSANLILNYELTDINNDLLIDSASIAFTDFGNNNQNKFLDGIIPLKTEPNHSYHLVITITDLTRDHYLTKKITLNRLDLYNAQNFLVLDSNNNVVFKNNFKTNDKVHIKMNKTNPNNSITLKYYSSDLPIAKPPFSTDSQSKSTTFTPKHTAQLTFDSSKTLTYIIKEQGLYHLQASESNNVGPTLFSFQEYFPKVRTPEHMIGPMRYISTKREYAALTEATNKKIAVDKHWINLAGSNERARTLIREYYMRVENANNYFTSYLEGWKTDRGIIYIIYGSPNVVYKHKGYENWIYGEENNMMSINFVFNKVANPINDNDYSLTRSSTFKSSWFRAVDSWRNGRVY